MGMGGNGNGFMGMRGNGNRNSPSRTPLLHGATSPEMFRYTTLSRQIAYQL